MTSENWTTRFLYWLGWYRPDPNTEDAAAQAQVRKWQQEIERRVGFLEVEVATLRQSEGLAPPDYGAQKKATSHV